LNECKTHSSGHLLVVLSGPEPQRTLLETKLLQQLVSWSPAVSNGLDAIKAAQPATITRSTAKSTPVVFVRGLPKHPDGPHSIAVKPLLPAGKRVPDHITVLDYADSSTLNRLVCDASVVISRAGYTTIMDLVKLRKKAVLIPTPGQEEQQYLGRLLEKQHLAVLAKQHDLNLEDAVTRAKALQLPQHLNMEFYRAAIAECLMQLFPVTKDH
jgi:hypothetical protein